MNVVLGSNVEGAVTEEGILTLTVDLTKRLGPSKSGKTTIVATSSGIQPIGSTGVKLGLNVFTK